MRQREREEREEEGKLRKSFLSTLSMPHSLFGISENNCNTVMKMRFVKVVFDSPTGKSHEGLSDIVHTHASRAR